jgi:hypothetical protein
MANHSGRGKGCANSFNIAIALSSPNLLTSRRNMTISLVDVISLLRGCSVSVNQPGTPLSVDSWLGSKPEFFNATPVEATFEPPRVLLRKENSGEELPVSFLGVISVTKVDTPSGDWTVAARFDGGSFIVLSTLER